MSALSTAQRSLLAQIRDATDRDTDLHRAGVSQVAGLCAVGSTVRSLARRGLVACGGQCRWVDGDEGTILDDAPWWAITDAGRLVLAAATKGGAS